MCSVCIFFISALWLSNANYKIKMAHLLHKKLENETISFASVPSVGYQAIFNRGQLTLSRKKAAPFILIKTMKGTTWIGRGLNGRYGRSCSEWVNTFFQTLASAKKINPMWWKKWSAERPYLIETVSRGLLK